MIKLIVLLLCSAFAHQVLAKNILTASAADSNQKALTPIQKIQRDIKAVYPDLQLDNLVPSPVKGIYQAKVGTQVYYITGDGHYIIQGDIFDLRKDKNVQNITEDVRKVARADVLKQIKTSDMIVFGAEKPKGIVTVLTDIKCGYCQKLHNEIPDLTKAGIQVRYLAFPRSAQGSPAYETAVSVWCANDPKDAYGRAIAGEDIPNKSCINTVASQVELGQKLGVRGTPTILLEDGTILPGYLPAEQLSKEAIAHAHHPIAKLSITP